MTDWPDAKIFNNVTWEIQRHSITPDEWTYTRISNHHGEIIEQLDKATGERAVVTAMTGDTNWYALTTRRIVGEFDCRRFDVSAHLVAAYDFGRNPKGYGEVQFGVATITGVDGVQTCLEFETGRAWMAPEYYFSWWIRKYPRLDVFKFNPDPNATP
ncbi:MAG: hypothetical protein GXX96_02255 [Planctomycetaceae bacterium]|nr:hypothetical protein [Planctomycetaceae bacterium]